jgi:hypothetical protein
MRRPKKFLPAGAALVEAGAAAAVSDAGVNS